MTSILSSADSRSIPERQVLGFGPVQATLLT
jgi:hypothetical protein